MIPLIDGYVTEMEMYSVMGFRLEGIVYDIYKHARQDNFLEKIRLLIILQEKNYADNYFGYRLYLYSYYFGSFIYE